MKKRIVLNDLKSSKLLSISTCFFMALSSLLFALTCLLFVNLMGSVDQLMRQALTPDYLQMHAGPIDEESIYSFAKANQDVTDCQILKFLNIVNGTITLGEESLADSTQDNGVSCQSERFDFLLDMNNQVIHVREGEIYVPACYRREYDLKVGEKAKLGQQIFTIAGFLRDSQMNSMMASSKRFLVSKEDYNKLLKFGSEEYLIEFLFKDSADTNKFAADYLAEKLPSNGPAITKPLMRLMNALSDGLMILVILLVSGVMLLISLLCIRFTLMARIASDQREIGMMKAVGMNRKDVRSIYFTKYLVLSVLGMVIGIVLAYLVKAPLQEKLNDLYGTFSSGMVSVVAAIFGAAFTQALMLRSIMKTINKTQRMSTIEAMNGRIDYTGKAQTAQFLLIIVVIALSVFLMGVPQNLNHTIASESFVTYMGIGDAQVRIDIRQTDDIEGKTQRLNTYLSQDTRIDKYVALQTKSYPITLKDGSYANLNVEQGDHTVFPVSYSKGHAPVKNKEIALSYLYAKDMGLDINDQITMSIEGKDQIFSICGIYSDITNGGKTAKTVLLKDHSPIMWSIFYERLNNKNSVHEWIQDIEKKLDKEDINTKVVDIQSYVDSTYGQTINSIRQAAYVALGISIIVILVVVFLFTRLLVAQDRNEISLKKAIGICVRSIRGEYLRKFAIGAIIGTVSGIILSNLLGEMITGKLLQSLGATGFHFIINGMVIYAMIPLMTVMTVLIAVLLGLRTITNIKPVECCYGRE